MRVLILGGDGYLGWPTAMHFSARGDEVAVVDNYMRRNLARETDMEILYPTPNLHERCEIWKENSGKQIIPFIGDICDWEFISRCFREWKPDVIIHYAEQPSAPYSMLDRRAAQLTLHNNLGTTFNVIQATRVFCPGAHIIKLGTMGEYGTPDIDIEEGWIDIEHKGRTDRFLYPRQAGSLYHTTKIMDTDLLWFYVRNWNLAVTDLMQGPVYGIFTQQSRQAEKLLPCFAYDEIFGTVLNRFIVQAVVGYPLTVYGRGGQTRGYLNLIDTLNCVELSADNPPKSGQLRIFNQFVETFSVIELAEKVRNVAEQFDLKVDIQNIKNPRIEKEDHYYNPAHTGLIELGLEPHPLTDQVLREMIEFAHRHRERIKTDRIYRGTRWA